MEGALSEHQVNTELLVSLIADAGRQISLNFLNVGFPF
jgi:hypothetical protein